jgi:CRISPR-associated endonuclease/helicase Cas3
MVMPLRDCLARPSETGQPDLLLVDHLETVASFCGDSRGSAEERMAFLAGLAHDAAKAALDWQNYIRRGSRKGPPHAPTGAAVFAFWVEDLVPRWTEDRRERERLHDLALDWTRVIDHHHGALDDLSDQPPWEQASTQGGHEPAALLNTCDLDGLDALVREHFPEARSTLRDYRDWSDQFDRTWRFRQGPCRTESCRQSKRDRTIEPLGLRMAELGARLIFADRRHAAEWQPDSFVPAQADAALRHFDEHCRKEAEKARRKGVSEKLLEARQQQQYHALNAYQEANKSHVLTLLLPTGYGKTLAGLRVALEAVRSGRCRRVLYVSPYVSILSQSAHVIQKATGLRVILHHQMSILSLAEKGQRSADSSEDAQTEDHQLYDVLDTWQAPIIATTFNQFFRALFPARAQQCLRIPALDGAFVFIDEPQIVAPPVWSAFLRAVAVVARGRGAQILFCTATLPPLDIGLGDYGPAVPLISVAPPAIGRFVIRPISEPWDARRVANAAQARLQSRGSVAVILNTVADAVDVWRLLKDADGLWFFLASRMLPGHKEHIIRKVRKLLEAKTEPIGVVCTQVLEAGVDLSFCSILRARPVFSSVIQAAGRGNRHGEGASADVIVFPFVRKDGTESRKLVYKDENVCSITDSILASAREIKETDVGDLLNDYYKRCWDTNSHMKSLDYFESAACGQWSRLAENEPFEEDLPGLDVFVPGAERYLSRRDRSLLDRFEVNTARKLLDRYLDRAARRTLSWRERRLQSTVLRLFLVDVPKTLASQIARPVPGSDWPLLLEETNRYCRHTGLAGMAVDNEPHSGTKVC